MIQTLQQNQKIRKAYCTTQFGDVYYWQVGSGPSLLMLHQASQSSEEFIGVASELAEHYTVVGLDYPGHGRSDDPDHELNVQEFTQAVLMVLDELEIETASLCGHHSGGLLAIDIAVNHASRVSKIILSGIGVRTEENVRAVLDAPMTRDLPMDADGEFLKKAWKVYRKMISPGVPADITFDAFIVGLEARRRPFDAHIAMLNWDRSPLLERIEQPTLLLCGRLDYFAERPEALLDSIKKSSLAYIEGGGPFLFREKPVECASVIVTFLKQENT